MVKDADGDPVYDGKKGEFRLVKNASPDYSGSTAGSTTCCWATPSTRGKPGKLNASPGECGEEGSKIWPFKVMRGKQMYDRENKTLIVPKLFGRRKRRLLERLGLG